MKSWLINSALSALQLPLEIDKQPPKSHLRIRSSNSRREKCQKPNWKMLRLQQSFSRSIDQKKNIFKKNIKKRGEEEVPGNSCTICENVF